MMRGAGRRIIKKIAKEAPGANLRLTFFKMIGVRIGKQVYIAEGLTIAEDLEDPQQITIGDRVAIGPEVILITSSHPNNSTLRKDYGEKKGGIVIQDDAWIGAGVIILPGVKIGKRAVIGAGSVVTKDVPDEVVYVGADGGGRSRELPHK